MKSMSYLKDLFFKANDPKTKLFKRCPSVTQIMESECGPASLSMLLGHYKKFVPLGVLSNKCNVTRDGTSASKLIKVANDFSFNLQAKGYRAEKLKDPKFIPCMVLWNYSHWIVIEGYSTNGFYINDPATGRRFEPDDTFQMSYSHICLFGNPKEDFTPDGNRFKEDLDMFETWKPILKDLILITFFASIIAFPNLVVSFITGIFAQNVLQDGWKLWYRPSVSLLFLMAILMTLIKLYQFYLQRRIRLKLLKVSIENFFNSLLLKDVGFYDQRQPGEVSSRLSQLTDAVLLTTGEFVIGTSSFIQLVVYFIAIFFINPIISCALFLAIVAYTLYMYFVGPSIIEKSKRATVAGGFAYSSTLTAIDSVETVKSMSLQVGALDTYLTNFNQQSSIRQEITLLSQSVDAISDVVTNGMKLILIALGSQLVINGDMQLSGLVTISMLLQVIDPALKDTVTYIRNLGTSYGDIARFADVYHNRSEYKTDTTQFLEYNSPSIVYEQSYNKYKPESQKTSYRIEIEKGSSFYYDNPKTFNVYFDEKLNLNPGQLLQINGDHGSGKTTTTKILLGDLKLNIGNIKYLAENSSEKLFESNKLPERMICSYVNEGVTFFPGPISDSITFFGQLHNLEHFTDVANSLGLTHYIDEIPGKLNYSLNATGTNISARLLKMLEIVRAITLEPNLIIFDYSLDDLDSHFITKALNLLTRNKAIVIVISHSDINYPNKIVLPIKAQEVTTA